MARIWAPQAFLSAYGEQIDALWRHAIPPETGATVRRRDGRCFFFGRELKAEPDAESSDPPWLEYAGRAPDEPTPEQFDVIRHAREAFPLGI